MVAGPFVAVLQSLLELQSGCISECECSVALPFVQCIYRGLVGA